MNKSGFLAKLRGLIFVALLAFGALAGMSWTLHSALYAQDSIGSYTVVAGDSLSAIAGRFGVSVEDLATLNNISDPSLIQVGQVLLIPSADAALVSVPTTLVQAVPGDTLTRIAARYTQDAVLLSSLNSISATARLFPGQSIRLPASQAPTPPLRFGAVRSIAVEPPLRQGRTSRLLIETTRPLPLTANWNGLPLALRVPTVESTQYEALVPVPALLGPGTFPLTVTYSAADGRLLHHQQALPVADGGYESQILNLPPDRATLLDPALVLSETAKVTAVWSQLRPELLWTEPFLLPIGPQYGTTSPFGTRRSYDGGPIDSYHAGQDFGAPAGVTVTASANSVVVLAEPLQVRGNAVLLDHGQGIFTGYWHLSELLVTPGQTVAAGEPVGLVGNTGLSTGAHLHWELRILGVAVDPMQFVNEPLGMTIPITP